MVCGGVGGYDGFGVAVLKDGGEFVVNFGKGGGAFIGVGRGDGAEEVDGVVAEATIGLHGKGDEVWVWVAEAFVVFGA